MKICNRFLAGILLVTSVTAMASQQPLNLGQSIHQFEGDPLDTWRDPEDARFSGKDLRSYFKANDTIRKELFDIRNEFIARYKAMSDEENPDYLQLSRELSDRTIEWITKYLDASLPASVQKSDLAFIGMGSLARKEVGPYTDLEGVLVWDEKVPDRNGLTAVLAQAFANLLDPALGHPIYGKKGFRLDEAQNSPRHLAPFAKDFSYQDSYCMLIKALPEPRPKDIDAATWANVNRFRLEYFMPFEGSWAYATTPANAAEYARGALIDWKTHRFVNVNDTVLDTDWYKWGKQFLTAVQIQPDYIAQVLTDAPCTEGKTAAEIKNLAKNIAYKLQNIELNVIKASSLLMRNHTFVYGNENLYNQFSLRREEILSENNGELRKKTALGHLKAIVTEWADKRNGGGMLINQEVPAVFDLKRQNYRFEEQVHTDLGILFNVGVQNQGDIIKALVERNVFGKDYGERAYKRVSQMLGLRWRKQSHVEGQLSANLNFLSGPAYQEKVKQSQAELEKIQAWLDEPVERNEVLKAMKQAEKSELLSKLDELYKLDPKAEDAVFGPKQLAYIRTTLIPEQAETYRRLIAFVGNPEKGIPANDKAFHDDFDVASVVPEAYGITLK